MRYLLIALLHCTLLTTLPALAQAENDPMTEPQLSYRLCEWGLLTIEAPTDPGPVFLSISAPENYSAIAGSRFTLAGTGAGLFEGNIIVEVADASGALLFETFAILDAEELGAVGDWSLEVDLGPLDSPMPIFVRVYSTSPEDGAEIAVNTLELNTNSDFGLPFVEITSPVANAGISAAPLRIEGRAGAAFENNLVVEVRDAVTRERLTETFATIETDELAGSGPFAVEVDLDVPPATEMEVLVYHPAVADTDEVTVSDTTSALVSPLAQTYERLLVIQHDDPITEAEDPCAAAATEFENTAINPLVVNDVLVQSTRSMTPLVNVTIEAAGSSNCAAPLRTRATRDGDAFALEVYYDGTTPVPCTADLAPITQRVSLGTLPNPDFAITVNGTAIGE